MTLQIDRESLPCTPEQFAAHVSVYCDAMNEYIEHLRGVQADATNETLSPDEKRVAFPPPQADMTVMRATRQAEDNSIVPDYELIGPSLAVRKQRLSQAVSEAEGAELAKVTPPGKARYWQMREHAILTGDRERWAEHLRTSEDGPRDYSVFVSATRSDEDARFLDEHEARRKQAEVIQFWAAKQHHDIEDLTEETVDGWKMEAVGG